MCRAASKMVPNRPLFGDSFDPPGSSEASCFQNKQSPSLERGGEGNSGRANKMDAYQQKAVSLRRQPLIQPLPLPLCAFAPFFSAVHPSIVHLPSSISCLLSLLASRPVGAVSCLLSLLASRPVGAVSCLLSSSPFLPLESGLLSLGSKFLQSK